MISKEIKTVDVPSPGDGRYWEQIQRNGNPEYVFYTPAHRNPITKEESINYDHFHLEPEEKQNTNYYPMPNAPWPLCGIPQEPSETLWEDIRSFIYDHVDFPDERLYDVKTAWLLCTWIPEAFNTAPYWRYLGTKNSGKTRALEVDQHLTYRGTLSPSVTEAALYRLIEKYKITYLLDETEIYNQEQKQATQHVLNAGYRRGQQVFRCEQAPNGETIVTGYNPFGFKALAGTRVLKDTLESRCIPCVMQKNTRPVNFMLNIPQAKKLRNQLLLWRFRRLAALDEISESSEGNEPSEGYLEPPKSLHLIKNSRIVEIFTPLIIIAEDEEARNNIITYAIDTYKETQEEESSGPEAQVLQAIISCGDRLESGKFATKWVAAAFNQDRPENEQWRTQTIGKIVKTLGFKPKRMTGGASGYVYDFDLISKLSERYEIPPSDSPSLDSLPSPPSLDNTIKKLEPPKPIQNQLKSIIECLTLENVNLNAAEIAEKIGSTYEETNKLLMILDRDGTTFQPRPGFWRLS